MSRMLVAASPVEIEAKAGEGGIAHQARPAALALFRQLTNTLGEAVIKLNIHHEDWPLHRFYLSDQDDTMEKLIDGLKKRADIVDVTDGVASNGDTPDGLFAWAVRDGYLAVLVGHRDHDNLLSETPA